MRFKFNAISLVILIRVGGSVRFGSVRFGSALKRKKRQKKTPRKNYLDWICWTSCDYVSVHDARHIVALLFLQDLSCVVFTDVFITGETPVCWPFSRYDVLVNLKGEEREKEKNGRSGQIVREAKYGVAKHGVFSRVRVSFGETSKRGIEVIVLTESPIAKDRTCANLTLRVVFTVRTFFKLDPAEMATWLLATRLLAFMVDAWLGLLMRIRLRDLSVRTYVLFRRTGLWSFVL